jgi:protein phosphatase PTC7
MLCGNLSKVNASINCRIHRIITRKQQRVPITRLNNPVLSLSSLSSTSFLSNSSNCYLSNKAGRKSMASSSSNAMLGDVYVDELISSYSSVQDFTKHAGVSFKDRTNKGFMKASMSLRRPQQLLYGPLNFGHSTFDTSWRIQNAGLLHGLWSKNLSTSSSACCLAGTAHDLSYDSSPPDELENSSTLPNLYVIIVLYISIYASA